jgi:hypothetical protein
VRDRHTDSGKWSRQNGCGRGRKGSRCVHTDLRKPNIKIRGLASDSAAGSSPSPSLRQIKESKTTRHRRARRMRGIADADKEQPGPMAKHFVQAAHDAAGPYSKLAGVDTSLGSRKDRKTSTSTGQCWSATACGSRWVTHRTRAPCESQGHSSLRVLDFSTGSQCVHALSASPCVAACSALPLPTPCPCPCMAC